MEDNYEGQLWTKLMGKNSGENMGNRHFFPFLSIEITVPLRGPGVCALPGDEAALRGCEREDARQLEAGQLARTRRRAEDLQLFTRLPNQNQR